MSAFQSPTSVLLAGALAFLAPAATPAVAQSAYPQNIEWSI